MNTQFHLDWLSFTIHDSDVSAKRIFKFGSWKLNGRGTYGYSELWVHTSGSRLMKRGRDDMGSSLQISGNALTECRLNGYTDASLLAELNELNGHASRVDLAIDIRNGKLSVAEFAASVKSGNMKLASRTYQFVNGSAGDTFYAGSRLSERFVRYYDKARERDETSNDDWKRLEMELKGDTAKQCMNAMLTYGVDPTIRTYFKDFIIDMSPACATIRTAIEGEIARLEEISPKMSDTKRWLVEVVAVSAAKVVFNEPEFLETFVKIINAEIERLHNRNDGASQKSKNIDH